MIHIVQVYLLPCCGFDRPGGQVTREVAELLVGSDAQCIVGSIAALVNERAGEVKDFRSAKVVCLDGCSVRCASKIAESRNAEILKSIDVSEQGMSGMLDSDKVQLVVDTVLSVLRKADETAPRRVSVSAPSQDSEGFLTEKIDKFTLRVKDGLHYSDNDFWVSVEGDNVRIGATDLLQQMVADIYYVALVELGREMSLGDDIGMIESTKTAMEVISPISGVIVERNERLEGSPELINESPYDRGWLYVVHPEDSSELELLKNATEYMSYAMSKAKHEIGKKVG